MGNDKDTGSALPGSDAGKRTPPTIDLAASEVTDSPRASESPDAQEAAAEHSAPHAESSSESQAESSTVSLPSRASSLLLSAVTGALAALLVLGGAKFSGLLDAPPPPAPLVTNNASKSDIDALGARLVKVESDAAKPVPRPAADPAIVTRLDAMETALASLRSDLAAARAQSDKAVAALGEIKSASSPQGVMTSEPPPALAIDTSAIEERIGKIERATAALAAAAAAPVPPSAPPEDPNVRRMAAASLLDAAVQQGELYAPALAAARSVSGDADVLKPLDTFAATGIPRASALSRELLALLPKLAPKPEAQSAPSGIIERLQQSAARLVRIQRVDATGNGAAAVLARVTAAAQRDDVGEAKRELMQLPASDRAPAQAWIAKVDARDAALAASRKFVADTMTALSKPAR
ncbi:hypothetical protein BH10PSE10_BH10PSE10_02970 [soil metagenome]